MRAQKSVLSEGFESNSLATNGWTTSNPGSSAINTSAKRTGTYGYQFYYYSSGGARYLISPELSIPSSASDITLSFYYKKSSDSYTEKFKVGYSTSTNELSSFTWSDEVNDATTSDFKEYRNTSLPSGTKYIAIQYCSGDAYYLYIDDINLTCNITGPDLGVYDGSTVINSDYDFSFGLATAGTTKTFTLKNDGTEAAPISVAHTGSFGAELSANSIPAGGEVTLTVTMPDASGDDVITISSTSEAIADFKINVSGTVRDESKLWCNFAEGLPTGWTNSGSWSIATSGADGSTSGAGYAYNTSYGTNKLMYSPLVTIAEGEKLYLMAKGHGSTASWNVLKIQYSADGSTWTTAKDLTGITNSWQSIEVSEIPAGNWYIGFYGSYAYFTDIYGGKESTAPVLALSQSSYDFGLIATSTTTPTPITITNSGKSALTGLNITSDNENFTVAVTDDATTIAANGGTATFNVTMAPNATGAQSATITIKSDNADDLTFTVTGAVAKSGTTIVDFNDNAKPANWTNSSSPAWSFSDGKAVAPSGSWGTYATLTTPKLLLANDDFLAIKVKANATSYGHLKVFTSTDGTSFSSTALKEVSYTELSTEDYKSIVVTGLTSAVKAIRIEGYQVTIDEIAGLTYAPVLTVKKGDDVQTTPAAHAFGEVGETKTVTYNFNNTGAGTINITNVASDNTVFTTNWTTSVAASNFDLVITANYDADKAGEQNGVITVTTTEGEFVINLTSTFLASDAPTLAVSTNNIAFGKLTEDKEETVTVTNNGTGSMTVNIASDSEDFVISPAQLTEIGAGQSKTFTITFKYSSSYGAKVGNVTVTPTYDETAVETIKVSGASKDPNVWAEDFSGNAKPDGWNVSGYTDKWTFADGVAKTSYSSNKGYLETPLLTVAADDVLSFQAKSTYNGTVTIKVYKKTSSSDWETSAFKTISLTSSDNGVWKDYTIEGLSAGNYKFRFENEDYELDNFEGFKLNLNDPKLAIYSDATATTAVTSGTAKDFGWKNSDHSEIYYIKNNGTGTLTISSISEVEGFTASTAGNATTIAAGADPLALTITMTADAVGAKSGTFTITTDGGIFTIPVSGFVYGDKNFIDFTAEGAKKPAGWSMGNWDISNNQLASGSSSTSMTTTNFTAAKGEKLYVEAISTATSYYYSPALTYSINGGTAVSIADGLSTSASKVIVVDALGDIDSDETTVSLTFTGQYVAIRRIYGFTAKTEPIMTTTAADIAFGMQTAESAEQTITISNEGSATLEGLSVTLGKTGDAAEYSIALYDGENAFTGAELEVGKTITVKVKQLFDINKLGAKSDVLTIAAKDQTPVTINLTGKTRDGSKQYVDFATGIPEGWTSTAWNASSGYASTANGTLRMVPVTVAANEKLSVDARLTYSTGGSLKVRYTTNNGVDWTEAAIPAVYNYTEFSSYQIDLGNTADVTAHIEFVGTHAAIDNVYGGVATTAPLLEVTEGTTAIANNANVDFGSNLQAEPTAKVYTLSNKGNASMNVAVAKTGDVTVTPAEATIAAGETANITVSLPYDQSNVGDKAGTVTVTFGGNTFTLNFTGNTIDPTALNEDLASLPAGWYNSGWTVDGSAHVYSGVEKELITELYDAVAGKNVLSFKAKAQSGDAGTLKVYTSADRKTWSEPTEIALTGDYQDKSLTALADGSYYVKFVSSNANVDDLTGLKKVTGIDHDLYVSASNIPAETIVPATSITATATVYSLRAAENGVYAKLFFDDTKVATAETQDIALNGSKTFTMTGNVPATEATYAAKIVVYYSDNSVAFETLTTNVKVEHTRTLDIQSFAREGEGTMEANSSNQISPVFKVTVKNTGTTTLTPTIKVKQGETVVGTATGTALAADATSDEITVNATNMSAGEGGDLNFTAEAYWSTEDGATAFPYATPVTINVTAAAPKFDLAIKGGAAVADGDAVAFGLVKAADKKTYTITNSGTGNLELISIIAPEGFEATTLTDANKTIAANGTLDIDVTLKAEQGKKSGALVFTYKVDATTNKTFTLNLSGRSVAADTWTVDFEDGAIPSNWDNSNGWTVYESDGNKIIRLSGWDAKSIMTPRLSAADGEILTFDVLSLGNEISYAYSTDKTTWSSEVTITTVGEQTFTAPAAGNYYLRFTGRNAYLDNFVGFKLNIPEHDTELAASSVPATGKQYNTYTATVTLKENAGKAEEVTAKLYVGGEEKATKNETITANGTTVVTLTWEPEAVIETAVKAYVKVTGTDIDLTTAEADLTVAEVYTLDETVDYSTGVETISTAETILLKRTFVQGWNTVCLPFAISDIEGFFGAGAKAYEYTNNSEGSLTFKKATSLSASLPYIVYVETAITEPMKVNNVTISSTDNTAFYETHGDVKFQGTYAPIAAGGLTGKHIVANKEGKGKIFTATDKASLKGFRAYFDAPATARLSIVIEGETTGINVINGEGFANGSDDVYNLNGQKVQNVKKGSLYIVNGKKQVVK